MRKGKNILKEGGIGIGLFNGFMFCTLLIVKYEFQFFSKNFSKLC